MKNELFNFLTSRAIFKDNSRYTIDGSRITASEKTEERRMERNRGRIIWASKNIALGDRKANMGTYRRKI